MKENKTPQFSNCNTHTHKPHNMSHLWCTCVLSVMVVKGIVGKQTYGLPAGVQPV